MALLPWLAQHGLEGLGEGIRELGAEVAAVEKRLAEYARSNWRAFEEASGLGWVPAAGEGAGPPVKLLAEPRERAAAPQRCSHR